MYVVGEGGWGMGKNLLEMTKNSLEKKMPCQRCQLSTFTRAVLSTGKKFKLLSEQVASGSSRLVGCVHFFG